MKTKRTKRVKKKPAAPTEYRFPLVALSEDGKSVCILGCMWVLPRQEALLLAAALASVADYEGGKHGSTFEEMLHAIATRKGDWRFRDIEGGPPNSELN